MFFGVIRDSAFKKISYKIGQCYEKETLFFLRNTVSTADSKLLKRLSLFCTSFFFLVSSVLELPCPDKNGVE